jgi:4-hydroxybenzoate polyprenyltransferase
MSTPPFTWTAVAGLLRLSSQTGTLLLMLPTLWALVLASRGRPPASLLSIFAAGALAMRSAGVILNDLADRRFDRQVSRTRMRPLASGALSPRAALALAVILLGLAGLLLLFLNRLTLLLSPIAVLLAVLYPYSKRVIPLPQAVLGIAFGWGVVMAWTAARNSFEWPVWLLYAATICWAIAYDTIYALQDQTDDRLAGIRSAALLFGRHTWLAVGATLAVMVLLLGLTGWMAGLNPAFYGVLAAVLGFFTQQVMRLRRPVPPALAFSMFRHHVWAGAAILAGIWLGCL